MHLGNYGPPALPSSNYGAPQAGYQSNGFGK